MKRIAHIWISAIVAAIMLMPWCFAQNDTVKLAETAREKRKDKQSQPAPRKVYDNDSLPKEEHISVVGQSNPNPASLSVDSKLSDQDSQPATDDKKTKLTIEPGQSAGDREVVYGAWRKKIADQKDTISLLQRELDVLQREYRLRAAAMYADIGNRLRNSSQWDKEDRDYKDKIEAKQKDLDRAKQQLSDLQDQAHKAGVPPGVVQ